jgi:hypothetical protein
VIDFSKVVLSKGSLSVFHGLNASLQGADLILSGTWPGLLANEKKWRFA